MTTASDIGEIDIYVGKKLRDKRQKAGLTLAEIANKIGVSHQQIQKYEHAQSRISASALFQLSKILGVTSDYFFDGFQASDDGNDKKNVSDIISPHRSKSLNILIVEDDPADELFLRRALENCEHKTQVFSVHDGIKALEFLRKKNGNVTGATLFPKPDIILLDVNIPKRDGHEVLKEIKRDRDIQDIPVIIITNGISIKEMISLYKSQAAGYVCKSFDFDTFQENINGLVNYWASVVVLPQTAT